ncbi:MAG: hypothetical protein ACOX5T_02550 [Candidatus Cryptobacteroides sp.]|jgi:hypothetical protein
MIDYVTATTYNSKVTPYLGICKLVNTYKNGLQCYHLEGCELLEVQWNPLLRMLRVKGSLPYFFQGHNFGFPTSELIRCVDYIDGALGGVGLWGAHVECFEHGVILPVESSPKLFIANHEAVKGSRLKKSYNERHCGAFVMWSRRGEDLKMYDAGVNIKKKQGMERRKVIEDAGWNPNIDYLKFEARYRIPSLLNNGRVVLLEKLQNTEFLELLSEDLLRQYSLLHPARSLKMPVDKKDMNSLDSAIISFVEYGSNLGLSFQEIQKKIYRTINDAECLGKPDKDSRKAQIRKAFAKLEENEVSRWDMTELLKKALQDEKKS